MLIALEGIAVPRKQRDHAAAVGVVAILLGVIVISGIAYTYMTRPALIEAAHNRVLDIRRMFEDTFH
jgi:hypothetical protein